jgi:hypothetical protein
MKDLHEARSRVARFSLCPLLALRETKGDETPLVKREHQDGSQLLSPSPNDTLWLRQATPLVSPLVSPSVYRFSLAFAKQYRRSLAFSRSEKLASPASQDLWSLALREAGLTRGDATPSVTREARERSEK